MMCKLVSEPVRCQIDKDSGVVVVVVVVVMLVVVVMKLYI